MSSIYYINGNGDRIELPIEVNSSMMEINILFSEEQEDRIREIFREELKKLVHSE